MIHIVLNNITRFLQKKTRKSARNHFYFNRIYFKRIASLYETFEQRKAKGDVHITNEPIQPLGLKFSTPYKEILKSLGKPSYVYSNKNSEHHHQALLIRQSISNINLMVQLQFHNDKLFFIALDVSKNSKGEIKKSDIINTVIQKYLKKPYLVDEDFPVIQDELGNFIIVNDEVDFSICYLDGHFQDLHKHIRRVKENTLAPEKDKKDKEGLFYAF